MKEPCVYAFIFARGGSKGLPQKNISLLAGKPLLGYAIETAKKVCHVQRVIVSTDCYDIAAVAREYGAETPFMRPSELSQDTSSEWLAWQHALSAVGCTENASPCNVFLSVPTTAPLRAVEDVDKCVEALLHYECDAVITTSPAVRHPMFNMVCEKDNGEVSLMMRGEKSITRRQDAPAAYDMTTVAYAACPLFIMNNTGLMEGRVRQVIVPRERSVDIDDAYDLILAEILLRNSTWR